MKILRAVLILAAVVAAAIAANVGLLAMANGGREPAGNLSPRAGLRPAPLPPPATGPVEPGERNDD
jgi:hypothetical protein